MSSPTQLAQRSLSAFKLFRATVLTIAIVMVLILIGTALIALILLESMPLGDVVKLLNIIPLPVYGLVVTLAIAVWVIEKFPLRSD